MLQFARSESAPAADRTLVRMRRFLAPRRVVRGLAIAALPWLVVGAAGCQGVGQGSIPLAKSGLKVKANNTSASDRQLLIAETYARQGQTDRAETIFTQVLRSDPKNRRAVVGMNSVNPRKAIELCDARVLDDVVAFEEGRPLIALNEPAPHRLSKPTPAVERTKQVELVAAPQPPAEDAQSTETIADEPVAFGSPIAAEPAAKPTPEITVASFEILADAGSGKRSGVTLASAELTDDESYFETAEPVDDASYDLGAVVAGESTEPVPEPVVITEEPATIENTGWTARGEVATTEPSAAAEPAAEPADSELPKIRPFGADVVTVEVAETDEAGPTEIVIDAPTVDLSPIQNVGWTTAASPRQASGKTLATVPQLTEMTMSGKITTEQLLAAQAACESPSEAVQLAACEAVLTHRPHDTVAWRTIDELLEAGDAQSRSLAALMLGGLPTECSRHVQSRLVRQLQSDDEAARAAAALACGGLGPHAGSIVPLLEKLAEEDAPRVAEAATVSIDCLSN